MHSSSPLPPLHQPWQHPPTAVGDEALPGWWRKSERGSKHKVLKFRGWQTLNVSIWCSVNGKYLDSTYRLKKSKCKTLTGSSVKTSSLCQRLTPFSNSWVLVLLRNTRRWCIQREKNLLNQMLSTEFSARDAFRFFFWRLDCNTSCCVFLLQHVMCCWSN